MAIRLITLWLFVSLSAVGQLVTLPSLDALLARTPIRNETVSVASGFASNDWGGVRLARHYTNNSAFSTNLGNVFQAKGATNGQWVFLDRTNAVQDIRWWRGGPQAADNTAPLTNAAAYVYGLGGGYVKADSGTHNFLSTGINMPSGVRLIGAGADATVFDFTAATPAYTYEHCIRWIGELSSGVGIFTNTAAGGRSLILDAPVGWAAGSMLQIRQTNYFSFGGRRDYSAGEFNYINTIDGGTNIFLGERLEQTYPTVYTRVAMWTPSVGSVEGIHFALGPTIGPVTLDYCDTRSYMRNCSAAGANAEHFSVRRSYGITLDGLFVDWDSDPTLGMNYGLVVGDSEYVTVRNCFFRTGRAGFDSGGSTIPTRYLTVTGTTMGSTRTSSHGAGLHEDVVDSTFESCVFLSGVSLGGGRNRLLNSVVKNNTDRASVAVPAGRYFDWEVRGNQIESAVDPTLGIVYGLRMYLQAGSQSTQPESTNYWPGTFGGTENQSIRITDNQFRIVGAVTNTQYPLLIDEATTLTSNTNIAPAMFGRLELARNQFFYDPAQPTNEVTSGGVVVQIASKIRWPEVIISDNLFASGPPQINLNGGKLVFRNNTVQQSLRKEGVYVYPTDVTQNWAPIDVVIDGNTWLGPFGSAFFVANTGGRLVARNNRVFDHGRSADSTYKFAFRITETTTNALTDIEFVDNLFASTNSPSYDVAVYSAVAPLWESGTQLGGSTTLGSRSAAGGYLRWPRIMNAAGATNGIALLGQYTALPTASSYPPGLAHSAGDLWYSDGVSWTNFMRSSTTNFHNLRSTNGLVGKDLIAETATLGNDWPGAKQAVAGTLPLFIIRNTNAYVRAQIYNVNTGSSGASLWDAVAYGAQGNFGAVSTNNSSGNALARTFIAASTGKGLAFELAYPNSMDMVYTYSGGTEFARLSTNTFSLPGLTTLAPTNVPTHVAIFDTDPTSTRRLLKSVTPANLKNTLAITTTNVTGTSATPLTTLLTQTPVDGVTYTVSGYYADNDWGGVRVAKYIAGDTTTTNMGNVFAWSGGRLKFFDATNSIQHLAWWGGGTVTTDNTKSLTNAANYVSGIGGGYVKAGGGTHAFLYGGIVMPSGVRLIGNGANSTVFNFTSATPSYDYEPVISWVGTVDNTVKLHSVPTVGDRSIVLSSSVSWANGDWIQLSDTNAFSFGSRNYYKQGEFNFVYSNTGGTNISLLEPLEAAYPTATTTINKITPTVGSAEGIHFALGTKSGGVRLAYADNRSYLKNCSAAGTEETHFWVDNCYGVQASGLTVDWDSDPSVGLNYGLVYGDSEYLQIGPGNFFRSARHGIASGGSSIPTRYCRVFNSTFGSTRQNVAGADMHGDVVESTFENCTFLSGLTLGGGRNRLLNSTVMNGRGATGVAVGECYYYDWEVRGNRFLISSFDDEAQSVWAMRFYLGAGSQSSQPASTNYWPGTWGGTSGQSIKILDNEIQFTGVRTNGNYAIFIDEAATLAANTNLTSADFGGVFIRGNRIIPSADQAFAQLTAPGIYVETRDKVRWSVVDISDNPWMQAAGTQVRVHSGKVLFNRNTVVDQNTREGVFIVPIVEPVSAIDVEAADNLFLRPIGSALTAYGTTGRVLYRGNRVFNHGSINSSLSRFALVASDSTWPISSAELLNNLVTSTNSPSYDVYVSTASGTLRDESTELGGSVSTGIRSAGGGYLRAPYLANAYGSTNAITLLGQYTALPTASSYPPGLAHSAGDLWYSDGASWTNFMRSGNTYFPSIYVTNDLSASNIVATTLTLRGDGSRDVIATPSVYPLYLYANTNTFLRTIINNISTGSSVASIVQAQVPGAQGYFGAYSTNNSSGDARARAFMSAITGAGLAYDLLYPSSMDVVWTYGGGTPFARLSTNTLTVPKLTVGASTNIPLYVATWAGNPTTGAPSLVGATTLANLKNSLAITAADITDSTAAGRALLTATDVAAQRTSLGLGTLAVINDAPSDGFGYVRSNAAWARQSGGGSGGVTTNLDNLTVTNTVRFGGNFYVTDAVGGTNRFAIISDSVNSYVQFTSFGDLAVSGGAGLYASSTNNWFYNGLKQYWSGTSDLVWLTSLGFKNATPLRAANILDSTTIDWTTSGTNVTPSIKSQSLSTNLIDSTFYSLLMATNTGSGTTSTNYLDRTLFYSRGQVIIGTTNALQSLVTGIPAHLSKTIIAGDISTNFALHVTAAGTMTSTNANWSNNKFTVKIGGLSIVHTITDDTSGVSLTDAPWDIDCHATVTATGTNATVYVASVLRFRYDDGGVVTYPWLFTFPGVVSGTLDTTGNVDVDVLYSMDTGGQEINVKCNSVVATIQGDEILTSGGSGSAVSASLVSVNGTTNNWNFNSTTPSAPSGGVNVKWQVSTTNASAYVPFGPFTNSLAAVGATNTTAATNIVSLTIPPLNNDGDSVSLEAVGWIYINSGGYVTCPPRVYLDGTSLASYNLSLGSAAYKKPWRLEARAIRTSSTNLAIQLSGIVGTGTDGHAVTGGYGTSASAYLVAIENVSANPGAGTNRLGLGFSMNTASTNNYWSTIHMKGVKE